MDLLFENKLRRSYPELFDRLASSYGVGDGWFDLLDKLCAQLAQDAANTLQPCKPVRVKEKLGELRFYCWVPCNNPTRSAAIK